VFFSVSNIEETSSALDVYAGSEESRAGEIKFLFVNSDITNSNY